MRVKLRVDKEKSKYAARSNGRTNLHRHGFDEQRAPVNAVRTIYCLQNLKAAKIRKQFEMRNLVRYFNEQYKLHAKRSGNSSVKAFISRYHVQAIEFAQFSKQIKEIVQSRSYSKMEEDFSHDRVPEVLRMLFLKLTVTQRILLIRNPSALIDGVSN